MKTFVPRIWFCEEGNGDFIYIMVQCVDTVYRVQCVDTVYRVQCVDTASILFDV